MRAILLFSLMLVGTGQVAAAAAGTGGYNLGWDECGLAGAANKDFACDTNVGSRGIVVSFVLSDDVSDFGGATVILQADAAPSETLPDWWALDTCRPGALGGTASFPGWTTCTDPHGGQGFASAVGVTENHPGANGLRFGVATAVIDEQQLLAGVEYYATIFTILNDHTSGSTACSGCTTPMTIAATSLSINKRDARDITITTPLTQGTITWQGGVVPIRSRTWGQIKGMYR